jgi:hypothetical protein
MYSRKLTGLIFGVFTSIVLVAPFLSSTNEPRQRGRLVIGSSLVADGSPMPIPKPPAPATLTHQQT